MIRDEGKSVGPGHPAIASLSDGRLAFSFHDYDGERDGLPWISVRKVAWVDG